MRALKDLLARTAEPSRGFTLIRDPARIMLSEIADAVAAASFGQPKADEHKTLYQVVEAQTIARASARMRV